VWPSGLCSRFKDLMFWPDMEAGPC
jgi:hypothetical protein